MNEEDGGPILSRKMVYAYPSGFQSYFIIGKRNIGKSTYALKSTYYALKKLGYSEQDAWEKSLRSICFSIPQVIDYLQYAAEKDEKEFILIWDDMRVFASGSQYFLNIRLVQKLIGLLDTIKIVLNNLIMTCPSTTGILGVFKSYDDYQIHILQSPKGGEYRLAKGYQWNTIPAGQKRIYKKFRDEFYCHLPDWVYKQYFKKRKQMTHDAIFQVKQAYTDAETIKWTEEQKKK